MGGKRVASRSGVKLRAVADTGPLLAAVQCGRVDLLQAFYEVLFVTPAQVSVLERHGASEDVQRLIAEGFLVVVSLSEEEFGQAKEVAKAIAARAKTKDFEAHLPEAQAIVLTMRSDLNAAHILLEESAARAVARHPARPVPGVPRLARPGPLHATTRQVARTRCVRGGAQRTWTDYLPSLPLLR